MTHKEATLLARESPCLVCGTTPSEPCHWPRHRGSGGRFENDWDVRNWGPGCRVCHNRLDGRNGVSAHEQEQTRITRYIFNVRLREWQRYQVPSKLDSPAAATGGG